MPEPKRKAGLFSLKGQRATKPPIMLVGSIGGMKLPKINLRRLRGAKLLFQSFPLPLIREGDLGGGLPINSRRLLC
jgi:hypothetical protein